MGVADLPLDVVKDGTTPTRVVVLAHEERIGAIATPDH